VTGSSTSNIILNKTLKNVRKKRWDVRYYMKPLQLAPTTASADPSESLIWFNVFKTVLWNFKTTFNAAK